MPFAKNGQVKLYFEEKGEGPPIIMINDMIEDHHFWNKIVDFVSKHFRVITFNQRGMGTSSACKGSLKVEDLANDVLAIADHLEIEKFHLIGDSMGGLVAQMLAHKHADRVDRLILSNAYTHLTQVIRWSLEITSDIFKTKKEYDYLYKMLMPWYFSSRYLEREDDPKELLADLKKRKDTLKPDSFKKLVEIASNHDGKKHLKHIKAQTLVIIAEEDIFCLFRDSRQMVKGIPNHQVELISGGHNSKIEHPNRYSELVIKFFSEEEDQ